MLDEHDNHISQILVCECTDILLICPLFCHISGKKAAKLKMSELCLLKTYPFTLKDYKGDHFAIKNQLLQLCTARTAWSDSVIRSETSLIIESDRSGPIR